MELLVPMGLENLLLKDFIGVKSTLLPEEVILEPGKRMSVLNQNHNMFDDFTVLETVLMGNKVLHAIKQEMDALYADYDDKMQIELVNCNCNLMK